MPYRRVVIRQYGPPEVLEVVEEPDLPEPGAGQVRVKVLAASASYTDTMIRKGAYPEVREKPPFALGYDMVGVVDKLGRGAGRFQVGDRVCDLTVIGAYSEYLCVDEDRLVSVPDAVDPGEAVSLVLSYMTAYQMIHRTAKVQPGRTIFVQGASGAVGSALLALAQLDGIRVYGTASAASHGRLSRFGATLIDYRREDFVERLRAKVPGGVDAAFDALGLKSFKRSLKTVRRGGTLVAYGFTHSVDRGKAAVVFDFLGFKLMALMPGARRKTFYSITAVRDRHPDWFAQDLTALFGLLAEKRIKPVIWKRLPLSAAREAHELIERSEPKGKIILLPSGAGPTEAGPTP
ncbi:MAG: medium chain dehydrogenase/reductase family protein [Desulfobacterales bacterium]|jgi:NADPH:quinone reductase-like Zn-dependent oxidoreductase